MVMDQSEQTLIELNGKLERMMDGIEIVKERQVEMADDVAKIKEAVEIEKKEKSPDSV